MNEKKLKQLLTSARAEAAPTPPANFAAEVLRAVRREPPTAPTRLLTLAEQLNGWCVRLTVTAAAMILLCVVADRSLTATGLPDLADGASQLASQYLFNSGAEDL